MGVEKRDRNRDLGTGSAYGTFQGQRSGADLARDAAYGWAGGRRSSRASLPWTRCGFCPAAIHADADAGQVGPGAMGHTQFMPSSSALMAEDFTADGKRDLGGRSGDALASTARYLSNIWWISGPCLGVEVQLPDGFFELSVGGPPISEDARSDSPRVAP